MLGVVAAACEFLPVALLAALFRWDDLARNEVLTALGSLFPRTAGQLRPFHLSIIDWLVDEQRAGPYFIAVRRGHRRLADYCWAQCERRVRGQQPLRDSFASYAFRHGVGHLAHSGRYADAVELLHYLFQRRQELRQEQGELAQFAKLVTTALGEAPPDEEEAKRISPRKLAPLLKGLYMTRPLYGGVRLLVEHHRAEWPEILEDFLATDDYVLRHIISEALADDYLEYGGKERLDAIRGLFETAEINHQELGGSALALVYAAKGAPIEPRYVNLLANGPTYPFRAILGDLLLSLTLQDWENAACDHLEAIKHVERRFALLEADLALQSHGCLLAAGRQRLGSPPASAC